MTQKSEAQILAHCFENTRQLTRFYLSKLKDTDMRKEFEIEGTKLNSAYWLTGHLVWAEYFLVLKVLKGPKIDIPWIKRFGFGTPLEGDDLPDLKEIFATWKNVHQLVMEHISSIKDEELDDENELGVAFGDDKTKRMIIHHVIRHEAAHAGHLGWVAKLNEVHTV